MIILCKQSVALRTWFILCKQSVALRTWKFVFKIKIGFSLFCGPVPSLFLVPAGPDRDSASTHRSSTSGAPVCVCTSTLASAGCPSSSSGHTRRNTFWYATHTGSLRTRTPPHRPYSGLVTCLLRRPEIFSAPSWEFLCAVRRISLPGSHSSSFSSFLP